jgi:hypothetical protein
MTLRTRLLLCTAILTGCAGLIDVPDLSFDTNAPQGRADASAQIVEGGVLGDGGLPSGEGGGPPPPPCKPEQLATDSNHCGACGHSCQGGPCSAGVCQPYELATVAAAPMTYIAVTQDYVFGSTLIRTTDQRGGIFRVPIRGGAPEHYVQLRYAQALTVLGDKIYFVVNDAPADGATKTGGLYSCPVAGTSPCEPTRIVAADSPYALAVDKGQLFFSDDTQGIMKVPPTGGTPAVFRPGYLPVSLVVDGEQVYYSFTYSGSQRMARLMEIIPMGADWDTLPVYDYEAPYADDGTLVGTPTALYFTAYDFQGSTGGVVRRIPRGTGSSSCSFGGTSNKRPYGLAVDATRVYWTNQGDPGAPYAGGSIAHCPTAGCCTAEDVETLWVGDSIPSAIAVDDRAIYWTTRQNGGFWKVAK